jgi:hypothetical protein
VNQWQYIFSTALALQVELKQLIISPFKESGQISVGPLIIPINARSEFPKIQRFMSG